MKLTPTTEFLRIAKDAGKVISWKIYARKVTSLSNPLGGSWTEITDRINHRRFPNIGSRIEYRMGQFAADKIRLVGLGIDYFKSNFFDVNVRQPQTIKGLKLWLKADAIQNFNDGDAIDRWIDLSGNANDATQATGSLKPLYKTGILNGKPIVRFDGTDDYLLVSSVIVAGDFTIFAVAKSNSATGDRTIFSERSNTNDIPIRAQLGWTAGKLSLDYRNDANQLTRATDAADSTNSWLIASGVQSGTSQKTNKNGSEVASATNNGGVTTLTRSAVGAAPIGTVASFLNGDIAEIIVYDRALTTAERQGIEYYLSCKYNLGIAGTQCDDYVEVKTDFQLDGATDVITAFSGFVDKANIEYNEIQDSAAFSIFAADEIGTRIPGERISTQIIDPDIDGAGTDGLVLQGIAGLFIKSANVIGFLLQPGVHVVNYQISGTDKQANLDSGAWVTLAVGTNTLGNGATASDDTQRIQVYVKALTDLPSGTAADDVIVLSVGKTLPNQWYVNAQARLLLQKLYDEIGVTTQQFDTLEVPTFDAATRAYLIDKPPNNVSIAGSRQAIETDGTDLFIAAGSHVYKRTLLTGVYTELFNIPETGVDIMRLIWNARNSHLWVYYTISSGATQKVRKWDGTTLSAAVTIGTVSGQTMMYSMTLIDYNYSGGSFKYGIVYTKNATTNQLRFINGPDLVDSQISVTVTGNIVNELAFTRNGNEVWYKVSDAGNKKYYRVSVNTLGNFVDDGIQLAGTTMPSYLRATYRSNENKVYYKDFSISEMRHHALSSIPAVTTLLTGVTEAQSVITGSDGVVYFVADTGTKDVYKAATFLSATKIGSGVFTPSTGGIALTYIARLYGLDSVTSKLFLVDSSIPFIISRADLGGGSIKDGITKVLKSFMLIGTISSIKKVYVYRRGDANGNPVTSGNTLSITVTEASILRQIQRQVSRVDFVKIKGETKTMTHDGAIFSAENIASTGAKVLEISSDFIRDDILKDLANFAWQFFKIDRDLFEINLGIVPLFHFEVFDNGSVTFDTTKIKKTASGPIYAAGYSKNGSMKVEVLL